VGHFAPPERKELANTQELTLHPSYVRTFTSHGNYSTKKIKKFWRNKNYIYLCNPKSREPLSRQGKTTMPM